LIRKGLGIIIRARRKNDFMNIEQAIAVFVSQRLEIIAVEFIDHRLTNLRERFKFEAAANYAAISGEAQCIHFATRFK